MLKWQWGKPKKPQICTFYRAKIVYNKAIDVAENYNLEISYYHTIQPVFFGSYCTARWQ